MTMAGERIHAREMVYAGQGRRQKLSKRNKRRRGTPYSRSSLGKNAPTHKTIVIGVKKK